MITVIEFGYRKTSWFVIVSQINYLPQPILCSPLTNHDILLDLVQYLFIILVIFAGKALKVEKVGRAFLSFNPCPSLAIRCNRLTEDVLIKIPEYNFLISKLDYFFGIQLIWSKDLAFKKVTNSVTLPVSNQISYETVLCVVVTQCPFHTISWPHGHTRRLEQTLRRNKSGKVKSNNQQQENSSDLIFLSSKYHEK